MKSRPTRGADFPGTCAGRAGAFAPGGGAGAWVRGHDGKVFGAALLALRMECRARNAGSAGASGRTILLAGGCFAASLVALIGLVACFAELRVARIAWSALVNEYYKFAPPGSPD